MVRSFTFALVMAGLYFHIPFCKRICAYCDFFRSADLRNMPDVVEAMHQEMDEAQHFISDRDLRTIYFGGGTPSLLHPDEFSRFIEHADGVFGCGHVEEITIEANPDDITKKYVEALRLTAVNRVSLGVQSFDDRELKMMNRRHSAEEAVVAVKRLQDVGIENITIDLIFGVDGFGEEVLSQSIEQALSLGVQHISAYHLTIEPNTAFGRRLARGEMSEVAEDQSEKEYAMLHNCLTEAGFEHYEVSNYALEGFRAKHNSSYWQGVEYLGIGVGAHSFNGEVRHYSEQSIEEYVECREYVVEQLTPRDHYNEYVMTALRRKEGIDCLFVAENFGEKALQRVKESVAPWVESGDVVVDEKSIKIPAERFMISDAVIESLFEV